MSIYAFDLHGLGSRRATARNAIVVACLVLVTGCATRTTIVKLDPPLDNLAAQTPLPVKAGVYYSPEFSAFQYERAFMSRILAVQLGSASVPLFDRVLSASFREVVRLDSIPAGLSPTPAEVDVIFEPRIEAFHHRVGFEGDSELASVTYQLRLYDPSGFPIGVRSIRGKAADHKLSESYAAWSSANLRDAADKAPGALRDMWSEYRSAQTTKGGPRIDSARFEIQARRADNPFQLTSDNLLPLTENGIVAVSVSVRNDGGDPVLIRDHDFALVLPTGRRLTPPPPMAILQRLDRGTFGPGVGATLCPLCSVFAGMAQSAQQVDERATTINLLREKGFRELMLKPRESAQATVFFIPTADVPAFSTADLLVWLVDPNGYRTTSAKVRVDDLGYQPSKGK
jgi:hypothetical protein